MKLRVLGTQQVDYVSKKTGEPVVGVTLHCVYKDSQVTGEAVDSVFISERLGIPGLDAIQPGMTVDVEYNRRGYVSGLSVCK